MKRINLWHTISVIMFIPALIGLFEINTLSGAILLCISISAIVGIEGVLTIKERQASVKLVVLSVCIMIKYYFKREDIVLYFALLGLISIAVFCEIELVKKRKI